MTDAQLGVFLQEDLPRHTPVPPEIIYWRAQLQVRREREEAAARPITIAQNAAIPVLVGIGLFCLSNWWFAVALAVSAGAAGFAIRTAYRSE